MSKSSEKVKRWRRRTKERLVRAMGGECVCCGYSKCLDALEFHHRDPNEKDVGIGGIRGNVVAWKRIIEEVKKCVLVCSNCHKEIHRGISFIPVDAKGFDESYEDYRKSKVIEMEPCPVCGGPKATHLKTCSHVCAAKRKSPVDWDSVNLEGMMKEMSFAEIGDELDVSDMAVRKRAKKLGLV